MTCVLSFVLSFALCYIIDYILIEKIRLKKYYKQQARMDEEENNID